MTIRAVSLVLMIGLGLFTALPSARGQQTRKTFRVGVLAPTNPTFAAPYIEAARQAGRELGYIEGQNVIVDVRFAEGKAERLPELVAELIALKPDAMVVVGDRAIDAAKHATSTIPIVMVSGGDPIGSGFVSSLGRPGGNVTGLSSLLPELNPKQLDLLKEMLPGSRVAILYNPVSSGGGLGFKQMQAAAPRLGISLQSVEIRTPEDIEPAFTAMAQHRGTPVVVLTDPLTFSRRAQIVSLAAKHRLPAIYEIREFVESGGFISYGPSLRGMIQRAPVFLDKIFKGTRPADIPVEQPTKFELVINLKTAKALGVTIPQSLLLRADQVIE